MVLSDLEIRFGIGNSIAPWCSGLFARPGCLRLRFGRWHQLLHSANDLGGRYLQHCCHPYKNPNGGTVDSAFDQADVRPVESAFQGEPLLRDFLADPDLPECLAERLLRTRLGLNLLATMLDWWLRQQFNAGTVTEDIPTENIPNLEGWRIMTDALAVDLVRIVLAAVVLFYVIFPLWASREWIAWGIKRGTVAVVTSTLVHQIAVARGLQPVAALLAALVCGGLAAQLVPARSRYIPTHVKRKVIGEYEARTGKKYRAREVEVDHVWPFARGGSHTADNLRVIPKAKNRRKGARKPSPKDWF